MLDKLISRFRREEDDHPLASEKRIAAILAEIREEEGEGAVLDVDHWLTELVERAATVDAAVFRRAVERFDDFVQGPLRATWMAWFDSRNRLYLTDKVWQTLAKHQEAAVQAYTRCLADPALPPDEDKNVLPRLAARALRAMVEAKKLQRMRYRPPDADWWERAGRLLTLAREHGASQVQVTVYPGEEPSSVWREYLVGVYLELAPVDSMTPQQLEVTDALLRRHSGVLVVRAQPLSDETFCVDPASPQGPFRRDAAATYPPSVGYIGLESLRAQIVRVLAHLGNVRDGRLPDWLVAIQLSPADAKLALQQLAISWSAHAPTRRARRSDQHGDARAVFGFALVRRLAACSALARSGRRIDYDTYLDQMRRFRFGSTDYIVEELQPEADPDIPPDPLDLLARLETAGQSQLMETWKLRDVSDSGIGVVLPIQLSRHAIGRLVGYRLVDEVDWQAGILRRLRRDATGRLLAGIERLPGLPVCAQVKALQKRDDGPWSDVREITGHGFTDAILISGAQPELLLPVGTFAAADCYRLVIEARAHNVRLTAQVASGNDYERVTFTDLTSD